jgi:hypothetical protein
MIRVDHRGSGSVFFTHPGSRIQGQKRHRIRNTESRPSLFTNNAHLSESLATVILFLFLLALLVLLDLDAGFLVVFFPAVVFLVGGFTTGEDFSSLSSTGGGA